MVGVRLKRRIDRVQLPMPSSDLATDENGRNLLPGEQRVVLVSGTGQNRITRQLPQCD
jgi:hypothetical protein